MRIVKVLVALVAVVGVSVGATLVANGQSGPPAAPAPNTAQNPNARLTVLINGVPEFGTLTFSRTKNVQSVTNPSVGVYCVRPTAASGINVAKVVPNVTLIGGTFNPVAIWLPERQDCPVGTMEFRTRDISNYLTNEIRFAVTVG